MNIQTKNRFSGKPIFQYDTENNSLKLTLELAVKNKANLREANLREANLWGANLRGANLWGANLWGANLWGANLWGADLREADLWRADLRGANLRGADLRGANLRGADLRGANLREADLREADLWGANLREADLREADLRGAENCHPKLYADNLSFLKLQPPKTKLVGYKYLNGNKSPYQNYEYEIGKEYKATVDKNETILCGIGLNLATLEWCLRDTNCNLEKTYIECGFMAGDAVIPYNSDGKFRVSKMKTLRKIPKKELENFLKTGSLKLK